MSIVLLSALVNAVIVSTGATLVIGLVLGFVPRRSLNAGTRYGIWYAVLLLVVGLPLAFLPERQPEIPAVPGLGQLPLEEISRQPPAGSVSTRAGDDSILPKAATTSGRELEEKT